MRPAFHLLGHVFLASVLAVSLAMAEEEAAPAPGGLIDVTAVAWAVAHADTGEVIAAKGLDVGRKSASITKTMTAHIITEMARENPALLDERIVFSEFAAATTGSRADLEAGESMSLRDALFGLMLPSGNDAGNALAEHFNDRFAPPDSDEEIPESRLSRANFVAEMNRRAASLGMSSTIYRIPYGDGGTPEDHTSSAGDILKLARAAMQNDLLREIVATKEYTGTVYRPDGTTREATWTNTNQFLGEEGFFGIKTGTTRQAGACLLTAHERNGAAVFVVVLGSTAAERRYADTRIILEATLGAAKTEATED